MTSIDLAERRARLAVRHHLATPARSVEEAATCVVGLHSSDPASVFLSAWARVDGFEIADLEAALYDRRSLVRMLGMRRTMFVVPIDVAATMDAACTQALAPNERKRLIRMLEEQSIADDGVAWIERVEQRTLEALERLGEATAVELTAVVPELGNKLRFGEGTTWAGDFGVSTRLLFLLATEGRIVRGRPLGTWLSTQYRWVPTDTWIDGGLRLAPPAEARADLARRWLRAFGPGTVTDLKWWTGWTVRQTKEALGVLGTVEVELDEGTGFVLADDLEPTPAPEPWVALLPGLDPTVMGWKERDWFLGAMQAQLFDRNGNAGPTVWANGRVVGAWGQRPDGKIAVKLLQRLGSEERGMIDATAARLAEWLGDTRITFRFRTALEKELVGPRPGRPAAG